ncbi:hypothetical protein [uncultured Anaerovibrio sp.]|uniref:hypothetical protein n=1 Tax=uncultured Anaerovibrio sp. TaxID=361586 RepID=UPI00262C3094|nr:hypothetical protein [uncultured Anaerovibrio sp.]
MSVRTGSSMNMGTAELLADTREKEGSSTAAPASIQVESFKKILTQKLGTISDTLAEMMEERAALQQVQAQVAVTEIVRRVMPDGSIRITEYVDGKVKSVEHKPPHMEYVVDKNKPIPRDGDGMLLTSRQAMVLKPKFSIAEELFNM